ncbi:reverse transcriptase family protein [Burkholderia multivorans]|uniref:Gp44 n=2 Tax=root TaxID=1 RepID=E5E3S8_9CAUD|nr:reverse transcriptase family protein [Burkholderia multivorans]YP_004306411.1 polymerase [Burkholderia phage KS5]ABX18504.1 hypothetical protein Bmul_4833 [Burkholderia multivorans ATCC 17616]ADP02291.1 gp44 [Burkholderia phage KS5]MBU9461304.1 reverse transcriptase family protein [Burkholderia multivorans]MBU9483077.1 reverse transcriptase family protein [Burkholderia multivorans]MBU9512207.1 reverse transcriptase family protein [Burkholderia multivorans]
MAKSQTTRKQYTKNRSPFFRLESRRKLATLLATTLKSLEELAGLPSNQRYKMFFEQESGRYITEPIGELRRVHKRIAKLLCRVSPPDFLQSATKGRSYKTNAEAHIGGQNIIKLDIKEYYPSVTFGAIYHFFLNNLKCSQDVATLLTKICTVSACGRTHLPTGSSLSPILSYWAYSHLFDEINSLCAAKGCTMTLYIDDITVSGPNADKLLLAEIRNRIDATGLVAHKFKASQGMPIKVTGVIVLRDGITLPHDRARDIRKLQAELATTSPEEVDPTLSKLVGKLNEAQQFVATYGEIKRAVLRQHSNAWNRIVTERATQSRRAMLRRRRKTAVKKASG